MTQPVLCTACGSIGYTKRRMKGSILTEFLLWCFFLIPGLIYSIWRHTTVAQVCPSCGSSAVIPTDSPVAQQKIALSTGDFSPDALSQKCPDCAETIKLGALVCRFCGHKFQPAQVQAAIQQAKSEFEEKKIFGTEAKDKISRNLCPNCDAYNAWILDRQKNSRKCEVCGQEYPLAI
jgi:predicted RNA-binding Zn-ribbon protein involved in translation (DUF1610 family)